MGLASQALPDPGALATQLLALIKDVAMSWGLLGASGRKHDRIKPAIGVYCMGFIGGHNCRNCSLLVFEPMELWHCARR